jgi:acyl carrier protein
MKIDAAVSNIVLEAVQSVADSDLQSDAMPCSPGTVLVGEGAWFDSMGFVNLVVAVEDSLERTFNVKINLSEELSSAFPDSELTLTAGDLANFLNTLLQRRGISPE